MKTMTCKQLGGACEKEFHANTFEEIAEMSKRHGMEMFQKGDEAHRKAMNEIESQYQITKLEGTHNPGVMLMNKKRQVNQKNIKLPYKEPYFCIANFVLCGKLYL